MTNQRVLQRLFAGLGILRKTDDPVIGQWLRFLEAELGEPPETRILDEAVTNLALWPVFPQTATPWSLLGEYHAACERNGWRKQITYSGIQQWIRDNIQTALGKEHNEPANRLQWLLSLREETASHQARRGITNYINYELEKFPDARRVLAEQQRNDEAKSTTPTGVSSTKPKAPAGPPARERTQ